MASSFEQSMGPLVYQSLVKAGVDPVATDSVMRLMKDAMPNNDAPRATTGWLYDNGPFSLIDGDPISMAVNSGGPLLNWIPSRGVKSRTSHVAHLEWVAPEGFDGQQTYPEYLAGLSIEECGYGPSTSWSGFQYKMDGGSFSWTTTKMKPYPDGGIRYTEEYPTFMLRGSGIGQPLSDDREWAVARTLMVAMGHLDYVLRFGNAANSVMEWDGINQVITPGYVQSRVYGPGQPHWADPLVINGGPITDPATILRAIRYLVRRLRNRIKARNWNLAFGDMVVYMPSTMWDNLSEFVAMGALWRYTNSFGFEGQMSYRDFRAEMRDVKSGGVGFGTLDIDNEPIPVLTDLNSGLNVTIDVGEETERPAVAGDIMILTRRVEGMTLLEQQYIDWNQLEYPTNGEEDKFTIQGGMARAGWITESNKCFYYYVEMAGRLVTYMQPLQARINNVVVDTLEDGEYEAGSFTSPDFYAYNGQQGGHGNILLSPV